MKILIDATNLRSGGGLTHLSNILKYVDPLLSSVTEIVVIGSKLTLSKIEDRDFIKKIHYPVFEKNYLIRAIWLNFKLNQLIIKFKSNLLFAPGGSLYTNFRPAVAMSRNSLPIELNEAKRYGFSLIFLRLLILRFVQKKTFYKSDGFIFLTEYSKKNFYKLGWLSKKTIKPKVCVIPHGLDHFKKSHQYKSRIVSNFTKKDPFKIIYVSIIDVYKHHDKVIRAIIKLNEQGLFVELNLVGPYYEPSFKKILNIINKLPYKLQLNIKYHGKLNKNEQIKIYEKMDLCLFASSCENMPNILLEGMSTGLPIISSDRGPMPEILKSAGKYFDPESVQSISEAIKLMYNSHVLRKENSIKSYNLSQMYSWDRCAKETFLFLNKLK